MAVFDSFVEVNSFCGGAFAFQMLNERPAHAAPSS